MTQITINVANSAIVPHLKKILNSMEGVSVVKQTRKSGIEEAYDDVKSGRVTRYADASSLFKALEI